MFQTFAPMSWVGVTCGACAQMSDTPVQSRAACGMASAIALPRISQASPQSTRSIHLAMGVLTAFSLTSCSWQMMEPSRCRQAVPGDSNCSDCFADCCAFGDAVATLEACWRTPRQAGLHVRILELIVFVLRNCVDKLWMRVAAEF
jgi:hypothetical protein